MNARPIARSPRLVYLALLLGTVALGLASRHISGLPAWLAKDPGDVLYATMIFWLLRLVAPRRPWIHLAVGAALFCFAVEFGQLDHDPWIESIRNTRLGGLVLGRGFHGTDLVCYLVGVGLALAVERALPRWVRGDPAVDLLDG